MDNVVDVAGIRDIDGDRNPFAKPQQRSGNLSVIGKGLDLDAFANLESRLFDAQAMVGLPAGARHGRRAAILQLVEASSPAMIRPQARRLPTKENSYG